MVKLKIGRSLISKNYMSYFADLEYGPGIVEKLKAKFGRISTGSSKRRKNHKRLENICDVF